MESQTKYYRHFKGGKYKIIAVAKDSDTLEKIVVYQAMYGDGQVWTRPYDEFFGTVVRDGKEFPRFVEISEDSI